MPTIYKADTILVTLGKTKLDTLKDSSWNRKTDISVCTCEHAQNRSLLLLRWPIVPDGDISHRVITSLKHCPMKWSWSWDSKAEFWFLIMLHITGFLQNIFLEDAPNFFRSIIHSFLSEHIAMKKGREGSQGYIIYITTGEYKWKFWLKKLSLGQIVNNKVNNNTLHL